MQPVSGSGLCWDSVVVCALGSGPRVNAARGRRAAIQVRGVFCTGMCVPLRVPPCVQVWPESACRWVDSPLSTNVCGLRGRCAPSGRRCLRERWARGRRPLRVGGDGAARWGRGLPPLPSPPFPPLLSPPRGGGGGALAPRRRPQRRRRPGRRHQIDAGTDTATATAIAAAAGLNPRWERRWEGGREPAAPRRPGAPALAAGRPHAADGEDPGPVHHRAGRHARSGPGRRLRGARRGEQRR